MYKILCYVHEPFVSNSKLFISNKYFEINFFIQFNLFKFSCKNSLLIFNFKLGLNKVKV